eukprot:sb/3469264/
MALAVGKEFSYLRLSTDSIETKTSAEQKNVEDSVENIYQACLIRPRLKDTFPLHKVRHISYLKRGLCQLSENFECLDASRPWICYWIVHSLNLLGERIPDSQQLKIRDFFSTVQCSTGGFCGNVGHLPHLATTYAAVSAIASLDLTEVYDVIDRPALASFLSTMHKPDGSFTMHYDGELDVRGAYCAAVVSTLTGIKTDEMFENTGRWVASCQTYEGGFGSRPGTKLTVGTRFVL